MEIRILLAVAGACAGLAACQTPGPIITAEGLGPGGAARTPDADPSDVRSVFRTTESAAMTEGGATSDSGKSRAMLVAGFDLVTANCKDYFRNAGTIQHRLNTSHDVTVATATFLAAAMGLNPRNDEPIAALPILTGAIYSGMDIYAKNYLFSAENIGAVEDLTVRALKGHQTEQLAVADTYIRQGYTLTYGQVVDVLQDNQSYCTPTRILPQVREAIRKGEVGKRDDVTPPPPADTRTAGQKAADAAALKEIGALFGQPGPISEEQALGYYWLYEHDIRDGELAGVHELLKHVPGAAQPIEKTQAGAWALRTAGYAKDPRLEPALQKLSDPLVARFKASIAAYRDKVAAQAAAVAAAAAAGGPAPPPLVPGLLPPARAPGQAGGPGVLPQVVMEVR